MKRSSLRSWIITIIVMIFVYQVYIMLGYMLAILAKHTGIELSTWQSGYRYGNLLLYSVVILGWLMSGIMVYKGDKENKLAMFCGGALIAYGGIGLIWQLLAILGNLFAINLVPRPLLMTLNILTALLMCAALIFLAIYYRHRTLRNLAIAYTVFQVIFTTFYVIAQFLPFDSGYQLFYSIHGLVATAAMIVQIIYLFKWAKLIKTIEQ